MGIVFGILIGATLLFRGVLAWGRVFPRFGRWLDARIYAVSPRVGHLFVNERETEEEDPERDRYDPFDAGG